MGEMEKMDLITIKEALKFPAAADKLKMICPEKRQLFVRNPDADDKMVFTEAQNKKSVNIIKNVIEVKAPDEKENKNKLGSANNLGSGFGANAGNNLLGG